MEVANTVLFTTLKWSIIKSAIGPCIYTSALKDIIFIATLVFIAAWESLLSLTLKISILKLSYIFSAIFPSVYTLAL